MGRGRAKAKQTKVARDLKYYTPNTDLGRLQQELSNAPVSRHVAVDDGDTQGTDPYAADPYADRYGAEQYDDEDDDESVAG